MSKPDANFGGGKKIKVYHLIQELIQEGKCAWFVNRKGRFRIKWEIAVERYIEYRAKKNPKCDLRNDRRKASNSFREALLHRYCNGADGAKEYEDCRKIGEKNKIVEREFQMPFKVFHSLFGSREELPSDQSGTSGISVSYPESTQDDQSLMQLLEDLDFEADGNPQVSPDVGTSPYASNTGFEELMDVSDDLLTMNATGTALQGNINRDDNVDPSNIQSPSQDGDFGESEVVEDLGYESSIREQLGTKCSFDQITCGELTSSESPVKMSLSSIDGPAQPSPEKLPVVIATHDSLSENISSYSNLASGLAEKSAEKSDVELSNERLLMNVQQELVAPSNTILFLRNPLQQSLPMGGIPFIVFPTTGGIPVAPAPTTGNNALNTVPARQSLDMPILPTSNSPGLQTALQASTLTPQLQNIATSEASVLGSSEALTTVDTTEISHQLSLTGAEGDRTDVEGGQQETENFKSLDQEEPNVEKTDSSQVPEKESAESIAVAGDQESSGLSTLQISDLEPLLSEDSGFGPSEKSEENTSQDMHMAPVGAATRGDTYAKNVMLLKNEDLAQKDGKILMTTTIEMARMRKTGQYKKQVQFSKSMSEDAVRKTIQETFPASDLSGRFYCASISNTDHTFQFHGDPRVWDGKTIRRILKGNSALYIVMEEIQEQKEGEKDSGFLSNWVPIEERMDVEMASETYPEQGLSESETSGILVSDPELKQEDQSLLQSSEDRDYEVVIKPDTSRLEGGDPFRVSFHPCLDANVTSVHAVFVKSNVIFGNVELAITPLALFGLRIPGAPSSGWANVILEDQNNTRLGFTEIFYFPDKEEADFMIQNPDQFKNFSEEVAYHTPSSFDSSDGDPQRYGAFGNAQQVQLLRLLIYTAARKGAQQFIEMILSTSAGRLVFNAYKDSQPLPEVVARDHGHNETACYLEGVTRRFSVEISASKEYPKKINWSELAQAAAEEAQKCNAENKGCHLISDLSKDAGYLGDVETSSSEPNSSGSEDDISIASKRECNTENESGDLTSDLSKDAGYLGDLETSKEPQSSDSEDDISIMSNKVNGDENLARAMNLQVIDVQSLQDTEVAEKFQEKAEVMFPKIREAVQCHPTGVDKIDDVKMEGKISDNSAKDSDWAQEEISTNSDDDMDQLRVVQDISPSSGSAKIFDISAEQPGVVQDIFPLSGSVKISDICTKDLDSIQEEICTNSDIDVDQRGVIENISPSLGSVKKGKEHADWDRISPQTIKLTTPECNTENESSDLTSDLSKDAGYLGDLETSSNEPQSSDSEDDIYITPNNGLDVHDVQSLQDTEDAEKFQEKEEVLFPKMQEAIQFLPTMADKLDDVRMEGKISDISTKDLHLAREEISTISDNDMDQLGVVQDISPSSSSVKKSQEHVDWDRISPLTIKSTTSEEWLKQTEEFLKRKVEALKRKEEFLKRKEELPKRKVPLEIYARDLEAVKAYDKALTGGKGIPLMRIGQVRSGKSNLMDHLPRENFNEKEESTVGLDTDSLYFKVSTETWKSRKVKQKLQFEREVQFEHRARIRREILLEVDHFLKSDSVLVLVPPGKSSTKSSRHGSTKPLRNTVYLRGRRLPSVFLPFGGSNARDLAPKMYGTRPRKRYREHLYKDIFVVDNTKSGGEEECVEVRRLREEVPAVAKELELTKEEIPVTWLRYENKLRKKRDKWLTLEEAKWVAFEDCEIKKDDEFSALLTFLHDKGIVIHFSDSPELERIVILDPQWLVDVLKNVITVRRFKHTEHPIKDLWMQLEETGILDEKLIDHAWRDLLDNEENHKSLIAVMERLSLISPWPSSKDSKQYLVPSMLMSPPTDDVLQLLDSVNVPSLFVTFASGRVPPGLFSRLISHFFQWCGEEWKSKVSPQLFHNFAMFHILPDQGISVMFWCHSTAIEVAIYSTDNDEKRVDISRAVYWRLRFILECMRKEFYWLNNVKYDMCVCCPVCSRPGSGKCRDHDMRGCECLYFWSEFDLRQRQHCDKPGRSLLGDRRIRVKQFECWFLIGEGEEGAGMSTNQPLQAIHTTSHGGSFGAKGIFSIEGKTEKGLALPENIKTSIQSIPLNSESDVKDIVIQFQEALKLVPASLTSPEPKTKSMIRCLALRAKSEKRDDLVRHLREITPAGTTGPLLIEDMSVDCMPHKQFKDLTFSLSGGDEWKLLAERLCFSQMEIRFLENRVVNPSEVVLSAVAKHRHLSVGEIYDTLVDCELPAIADLM